MSGEVADSWASRLERARAASAEFRDRHLSGKRVPLSTLVRIWRWNVLRIPGWQVLLPAGERAIDADLAILGRFLKQVLGPEALEDDRFSPTFRNFVRQPAASRAPSAADCVREIERALKTVERLWGPGVPWWIAVDADGADRRRGLGSRFHLAIVAGVVLLIGLSGWWLAGDRGSARGSGADEKQIEGPEMAAVSPPERGQTPALDSEESGRAPQAAVESPPPLAVTAEESSPPEPNPEEPPLRVHWLRSEDGGAELHLERGDVKELIRLVRFTPGTFEMGSENGDPDERPVWQARIGWSFFLAATETTRVQHQLVSTGERKDDGWNLPVVNISWLEAKKYCQSIEEALDDGPDVEVRLPLEAEWEYAAQQDPAVFAPGKTRTRCREPGPVYEADRNHQGIYGMAGNVQEWVEDWYQEKAYLLRRVNGPTTGKKRVVRGGSCNMPQVTYTRRSSAAAEERHQLRGFRIVAVLSTASPE